MLLSKLMLLIGAARASPIIPTIGNTLPDSNTTIHAVDDLSNTTSIFSNTTSILPRDFASDHPIGTCKTNHLPLLSFYNSAVGDACGRLWGTTSIDDELNVTISKPMHWDQTIPVFDNKGDGIVFRFSVSTSLDRDTLDPPRFFTYNDCLAYFGNVDNTGILTGGGLTKCYAKDDGDNKDVLVRGGKLTLHPAPIGSDFSFLVKVP